MQVSAAAGAQRDRLCDGCTRRRLGCRKGCTRGAEEEIMKILLAGEREKKRRREQDTKEMKADNITRRMRRERKCR